MRGLLAKSVEDLDKERYDADVASVEAQLAEEPEPTVAPLPPYDHDAPCPKCRYMAGTTQFRRGYHGNDCSIPENPYHLDMGYLGWGGWPSRESILSRRRRDRAMQAIPQHFERECPNCKHKWAEAVAA